MQPADDNTLLRQYVENHSDEAFAALVERYINLVYSVALRQVGDVHDAEEIAQAVFIILTRKAASLRHDKALSSWLFQTTRLTANNVIRSGIRRQHREQEAYMQSLLNEPNDESWRRIAPMLDAAVGALAEKDRRAILLRFYEGRNLQQVGAILGASEDAAEKRVTRALEKLRKFFSKHGVDSTTAAIAGTMSVNSIQVAPAGLAKTISAVALAKGAAASASTLTLTHGVLKIMAWTKMKTAIVLGAVVIAATGVTIVAGVAAKARHGSSIPIFAGQATPEATVQSTIWAAGQGDLESLSACSTPRMMGQFKSAMRGKSDDEIKRELVAWAGAMADYKITQKEVISGNEVYLHIRATPSADALQNGKTVIIMKKIGNEWKMDGHL